MLNTEHLDDALLSDGFTEIRGQASRPRAAAIAADEMSWIENGDPGPEAVLRTRPGSRAAGDPPAAGFPVRALAALARPGAAARLVAVAGGKLWQSESLNAPVWSEEADVFDPAREIHAAQLLDVLYLSDGDAVRSWDGDTLGTVTNAPAARLIAAHAGRLFTAGSAAVPDALYASDLLDGAEWPDTPANRLRVGSGDGEPVTALLPWRDNVLLVFKERSVWAVAADPREEPGNWFIARLPGQAGCSGPRALAAAGNDVFFANPDGIHSLTRAVELHDLRVSLALSRPVEDITRRVTAGRWHQAALAFHRNRLLCALPLDGGQETTAVLVYHTLHQRWGGLWTGIQPRVFCRGAFDTGEEESLLWGDAAGRVHELRDDGVTWTDAGGEPVRLLARSRAFTFGEPFRDKTPRGLELEFRDSRARARVRTRRDGRDWREDAFGLPTAREGVSLPFDLPVDLAAPGSLRHRLRIKAAGRCRELEVEIAADPESPPGPLGIRAAAATAFPETLP